MKQNNLDNSITQIITDDSESFFTEIKSAESLSHKDVLSSLLKQIVKIDFQLLAFPLLEKIKEEIQQLKLELTLDDGSIDNSHQSQEKNENLKKLIAKANRCNPSKEAIIVLAIENLIELAKMNKWNMCKNGTFIYLFNGEFWNVIDENDLKNFLGKAGEKMGIPKFTARYCKYKDLLLEQFLSAAYMPAPKPLKDKVLINLLNGTYEIDPLKGNVLRPFDSRDFLKYQLPFSYDPQATAPIFKKYIERVLPDIETRMVLLEYLGFLFVKHNPQSTKLEKVLLCYGTGANGKSVLFEVLNALLGPENVCNFSLSSLTADQNGYSRAMIEYKLLNYASEISGKIEASIFKQLASGEPISARLPYQNPMMIYDYAKLIFNCNELPKVVENNLGFFRRFIIIPFEVTIPENEQDRKLHTKIINSELSGVFNLMLEGLERLLANGNFTESANIKKSVYNFKMEADTVYNFLNDNNYKPHPTHHFPLKSLFEEYSAACIADKVHPVTYRSFSKSIDDQGFVMQRQNTGMSVYCYKQS